MLELASRAAALAAVALALAACGGDPGAGGPGERAFDFETGPQAWSGDLTDFPVGDSPGDYDFAFEHRQLPEEVAPGAGLHLAAHNTADDLFMFARRRLGELEPGADYRVHARVVLASSAASGCAGIGGAPGESVHLKLGASAQKPEPVARDGRVELSVDKGNQASGGARASVIGTIANGSDDCTGEPVYRRIERAGAAPATTASADGALWVFVGTDSGFEGTTALYLDRVELELVSP